MNCWHSMSTWEAIIVNAQKRPATIALITYSKFRYYLRALQITDFLLKDY